MSVADAAASDVTVDDLDLPRETIGHISGLVNLEEDDVIIVYAPKRGDGKAELMTVEGSYRVTFVDVPPDGVSMHEREWFGDLGSAVRQLAEWMMLEPDALLDIEDEVNG